MKGYIQYNTFITLSYKHRIKDSFILWRDSIKGVSIYLYVFGVYWFFEVLLIPRIKVTYINAPNCSNGVIIEKRDLSVCVNNNAHVILH